MASRRASPTDLPLALALLLGGLAASAVASRLDAAAFHFLPSMDGCVTAGAVGFGLLLFAGVPYRQAIVTMLPIFVVQIVGARVHHASVLAVLGVEALVIGAAGATLAWRARPAAPRELRRSAERGLSSGAHPRPAPAH